MKTHPARSLLLVACLGAALPSRSARAEGDGSASLAASLSGEAKAAYTNGRQLFDVGDHTGALAKFSQAYDLSHDARLLWNVAVCEKELHHYARTAALLERYLKEGAAKLSAEQRQRALDTRDALRALYAPLKLNGVPSGAKVWLDGELVGEVPLADPQLVDLGPHLLRVEQAGFAPNETKLQVPGGRELEVTVKLKPLSTTGALTSRLNVTSSDASDIVAIDGKVVGSGHWQGQLPSGEHVLRVTGSHKKPYESRVQLAAGDNRSLQVTLENESSGSHAWLWLTGGALLLAGAAVGGYVLFKPQETPGPHPEGSLSTVTLPFGVGKR